MSKSPTRYDHQHFMRLAIRLARRGLGRVEPNPMVGCVIVKHQRILGQGYHRRFGGPHAEVFALRQAGPKARGASAYISLEPCAHHGKTPPCTAALLDAGIARVIIATRDPNPRVAGKGLRLLRRHGVKIVEGILREESEDVLAPYLKVQRCGLPYVIAKWAQSLDGRLATRLGESKWISSDVSRAAVQRLRSRVDAVVVGSETVLRDDPSLTCRGCRARRLARRVVLDTRLRTPPRCRLAVGAREVPTTIFTSATARNSARARRLIGCGIDVQALPLRGGRVSLRQGLRRLARMGATNVLVEGGGRVLGNALDLGLLDECYVFVAPRLMGGGGPALDGEGVARMALLRTPDPLSIRRSGSDMVYHFKF